MRISLFIIVTILVICSNATLWGQEGFVLENIYFEGNASFSESELINQTSLYTVNWFEKSILRKDPFIISEDFLDDDLEKLVVFYQQNGYLEVQINAKYAELDHENNSLDLKIMIEENKPVFVSDVYHLVNSDESSYIDKCDSIFNRILPNLKLYHGERFRDNFLEQDRNKISDNFLNAGFAYVEIESDILLSDNEEEVEIAWLIKPGPLCYFGQIEIFGEKDVEEDLILDRIEFKSGELYQKVLLDTTHHSIYSLGLFQVVSVQAILHQQKSHIIPVRITVKEASKYTTKFGVGYGSEDKFRVFADILKIGFLGGARRLNLLLSHSGLQPYNIDLRFTQPAFLIRPLVLILNPYFRKQDEPGYKVERKGARSTFLYSFSSRITSSFTYTYEDVKNDTVDFGYNEKYSDDRYKGLYDKSMVNLGFNWDTSYPMFYPFRGIQRKVAMICCLNLIGIRNRMPMRRMGVYL